MKVTTTKGKVLDSAKMTDKDAEILEALNKLYDVCKRYEVTSLVRIILNNKKYRGAQTYGLNKEDDLKFMYRTLNEWIATNSKGKVQVVEIVEKPPSET